MVYTPEGLTDNSTRYSMTATPVKEKSDRKSLCLFTNILYMKKMLSVKLQLINQSARKSNQELLHGH